MSPVEAFIGGKYIGKTESGPSVVDLNTNPVIRMIYKGDKSGKLIVSQELYNLLVLENTPSKIKNNHWLKKSEWQYFAHIFLYNSSIINGVMTVGLKPAMLILVRTK
jgi:hypothetical protein